MARPSNTDERRAQITLGLMRVMAKQGYDGASVGDIAKAAGLSPGLVHYHFKNKREILLATLETLVDRHRGRLEAQLEAAGPDPAARLGAFLDGHLGQGAAADPEALACWVLLSGEALRDRLVKKRLEAALLAIEARLVEILAQGQGMGRFQTADPGAAAAALLATIQGYFLLAATARSTIPQGSAQKAARLMAEGLLGPIWTRR